VISLSNQHNAHVWSSIQPPVLRKFSTPTEKEKEAEIYECIFTEVVPISYN
jgi:hypothetical protein